MFLFSVLGENNYIVVGLFLKTNHQLIAYFNRQLILVFSLVDHLVSDSGYIFYNYMSDFLSSNLVQFSHLSGCQMVLLLLLLLAEPIDVFLLRKEEQCDDGFCYAFRCAFPGRCMICFHLLSVHLQFCLILFGSDACYPAAYDFLLDLFYFISFSS